MAGDGRPLACGRAVCSGPSVLMDPRERALRPDPGSPRKSGDGEPLPLLQGSLGPAVSDLQTRLERLGFVLREDEPGHFGEATARAVRAFQSQRGLKPDGICDRHTWSGVVEAGFRIGDRLLYRRNPMLHGDDVAELQRRLSSFGFDPGRVDGIFGDATHVALAELQRNLGMSADGICGPRTVAELLRLAPRAGTDGLVSSVREVLKVTQAPATLRGRSFAVGEEGGFPTGVAAVCRALALAGARPLELHHPDPSEQAADANSAGVDCYVGLRLDPTSKAARTTFYRGFRYESVASRRLAELLGEAAAHRLNLFNGGAHGMAEPILRETRMPAVVLELGLPHEVSMRPSMLGHAVAESLEKWLATTWQ